jgi:prevent-host-death family protein
VVLRHNWTVKSNATPKPAPKPPKKFGKQLQVNLYEAKTQLSSLVERAARGEEIIIAKAGKPMARLVSPNLPQRKRRWGQNLLGITSTAPDFDAPLPDEVLKDFGL